MAKGSDTWVCIGTGPSLTSEDIEYCRARGWSLATCNNAIFYAPDAKIHHACDYRWWRMYGKEAMKFRARHSTCSGTAARRFGITFIMPKERDGFSAGPGCIYGYPPLSGYQLIQIVSWEKPERIILLGYDMQHSNGRAHVHGDHPADWPNAQKLEKHIRQFDFMGPILRIPLINCSRDTALTRIALSTVDSLI